MNAAASKRDDLLAVGLAFIAGYVDTVGFVALFGLFTAHITGNFVLIGSVLARSSGSVLLKLLVFPSFIAAVVLTRLIVLWIERQHRDALIPLLLLQFVLLGGFAVLGVIASPISGAEEPFAIWAGISGAATMGVQNAAGRLVLPNLVPTTVMTGNVTQLVIDGVDLARGAGDADTRTRSAKLFWPIVAFVCGAISGGFGVVHVGFVALSIPMILLLVLSFTSGRSAAPVAHSPR